MSDKTSKEQVTQKREEKRRKKALVKSLEKENSSTQKALKASEKKLKTKQRQQSQYEQISSDNPFGSLSLEELEAKYIKFEEKLKDAHAVANDAWKKYNNVKQEIKKITNGIKQINAENRQRYKEALKNIEDKLKKNGLKVPGSLPHFENNEEWPESDGVQQEFDKEASQGDDLVQNGMSKIGTGKRNVLMTIDKIENDLEAIDLSKIFKERLGLDELKNYNDFISEIRNVGDQNDSAVKLVDKQYFPATTKFDVSRAELRPNNMEAVVAIRNKNMAVINELAAIFRIKMRNTKHIKFKGHQEEGIIDARNVYKIPHNLDENIFEKAFVKPNDKVVVSVALDISGSMDKDYTNGGKRLMEIAVILDAALSKASIKHEVVGYGAPVDSNVSDLNANEALYTRIRHRLETVTYRTFEGANGLGNISTQVWDNVDAESLRVIAARLMRSRSKMKVIINITDGKPFLHGSDAGILDNDLKKTLSWLGANKVKMYAMGFNDYPKHTYGPEYLKINEYSQLPKFFRDSQ